jgi:hypothetical protein
MPRLEIEKKRAQRHWRIHITLSVSAGSDGPNTQKEEGGQRAFGSTNINYIKTSAVEAKEDAVLLVNSPLGAKSGRWV